MKTPGIALEESRSLHQFQVLNEVAQIATQDLELRPMLQRIATTLRRRLGGDLVTLLSVDRDRFVCEALATDLATDLYVGYVGDIGTFRIGRSLRFDRRVIGRRGAAAGAHGARPRCTARHEQYSVYYDPAST